MSDPLVIHHRWANDPDGVGPLAFTSTRAGGVSEGCHSSLNIGRNVGDDDRRVTENRARLLAETGLDPDHFALCHQTHSTRVAAVSTGGGALDVTTQALPTDGLATARGGLAVGVMTADCVPILLWAPEQRAVAAVHVGRVGLYDGIIANALKVLSCGYTAPPGDVRAIIGPSIGPCCYEVSPELADAFRDRFGAGVALGRQLDLWSASEQSLLEAGVLSGAIRTERLCTSCSPDRLFSHRRDGGQTGRMVSVVVAPGGTPRPAP